MARLGAVLPKACVSCAAGTRAASSYWRSAPWAPISCGRQPPSWTQNLVRRCLVTYLMHCSAALSHLGNGY
eukprot:scaffold7944_cov430-Prasinococcus_capsulatus_cf.AAC.2